jgi:hypothetical protein
MDSHRIITVSVVALFAGCSTAVPTGGTSSRESALTFTTCAEVGASCPSDGGEVDTGLVSLVCGAALDSGVIATEFCYCAAEGIACYTIDCARAADGTLPAGCCECPTPIGLLDFFPTADGGLDPNVGCVCPPGVPLGCNNPNAAGADRGKCKGHYRDAAQ